VNRGGDYGVEGVDRGQSTLFRTLLDDYVAEDNPVRAVDVLPRARKSKSDEVDLKTTGPCRYCRRLGRRPV